MPSFGTRSEEQLATLHPALEGVLREAIKHYNFSVIQGYRGEEDQNRQYAEGDSQLRYPQSQHNKIPARAVDIIPYPTGYDNIEEFYIMATHVLAAANKLGVSVTWGGHWKSFKDYPHFELNT